MCASVANPFAKRTEYLVMNCAYHLVMDTIYSAVPIDRRMASALLREEPEDEDEGEKKDDNEEDENEEDGDGYSE